MRRKTSGDVRELLRKAVDKAGGFSRFAELHGMSTAYVHDAVNGKRGVGPKLLGVLGLREVKVYEADK